MSAQKVNKKEEIERKKRLAFTLYVDNGFSQKVIAEITGISERSISTWKKDNDWDRAKEEARMGLEQQRKRLTRQIDHILTVIEARPEPNNIPTSSESDTINKLADAAKKLQTELSFAHKAETGKQYIRFIQEVHGQDAAILHVEMWHEFLMSV